MKALAVLALIAVTTLGAVMPATVDLAPAQAEGPSSVEIGRRLRLAIDAEYRRMSEADQLRPSGQGGNPIAGVVEPFISSGMSFEDAESILRSAGFEVGARTQSDVLHRPSVTAVIDRYPPRTLRLVNKVSVVVLLYPENPESWKAVGSVTASFVSVFL